MDLFLFAHGLIHPEHQEEPAPPSPVALTPEERRTVNRAAMAAGWTAGRVAADILRAEQVRRWKEWKKAADIQKAEELFRSLSSLSLKERRGLIEAFPKFWSWALAERVCAASLKSASHKVEEALELAELAVSIAERAPGAASWRSRLLGYCWAHVANARRVANDLAGADETFARAWHLWGEGAESSPDLLDEWLLPAMEASLRRAQRRFTEAAELLALARTSQGGSSPAASLSISLNESSLFSLMGEPQLSLEAMAKAAQLCQEAGDLRKLFALRFNMVDDLCHLERFGQASELLPQVRDLALQQGNELDLIRVSWLSARVAAGEGRTADAMAGLEQVRRDFTVRSLPYDAALSSLDLSVLLLQEGRTVEVRELALAMGWIFKAQGIAREALAALQLFCDAARQETTTVELVRQIIADIEKVRRSASSSGQ
ncbi:MAG TPA: hypothetical protein VLQ45_09640 [Thermoanaerobaculia bacterium]|nr:hypothetical protein [Thermoanaerobaculia bacterium]